MTGQAWWVACWAPRFMLALHLPVLAQAPIIVVFGGTSAHSRLEVAVAIVLAAIATGLHLRHIRAAARNTRPNRWPLTLAAQTATAFGGLFWFGIDWTSALLPATASAMLLLPGLRLRVFTAVLAAGGLFNAIALMNAPYAGAAAIAGQLVYYAVIMPIFAWALYGTVRLVPLVWELYRTRLELADAAVDRERLRLSRDLHDLLGQSLSAIALKGDLALRMLPADPSRAEREAGGIADIARAALVEIGAVTRDERRPSLLEEIGAAAALLAAAGVDTEVDVPEPPAGEDGDAVLAWAVREGVTNLLRHSRARTCSITLRRNASGGVVLELVNDGAQNGGAQNDGAQHDRTGNGTGLTGLAERVAALGGSAGAVIEKGRFRLRVELPDAAA